MGGLYEKPYSLPRVGRGRYCINASILLPSLPETSCTQVEFKPIDAKKIWLRYILAFGPQGHPLYMPYYSGFPDGRGGGVRIGGLAGSSKAHPQDARSQAVFLKSEDI